MQLRWPISRRTRAAASLCLMSWLFAPAASAYTLLLTGTALEPYWLIVCDDGPGFLGFPSLSATMQYAEVVCGDFGGVAPVGEAELEAALSQIEPGDPPSSAAFARDLGAAGFEALTAAELDAIAAGAGSEAVELVDYELVSVLVAGRELLAAPVSGLPGLPLFAIYANEDDAGPAVGGPTVTSVPIGVGTAVGTALLLLTSGVAVARKRRRSRPAAG